MAVQGFGGSFKIWSGTETNITEVAEWEIEYKVGDLNKTNFDSLGRKEILPGISEWEGKATMFWNIATDTTGQKAIQDAAFNKTKLTGRFRVNATNYYSGDLYITGFPIKTKVDDLIQIEIKFAGTGQLSYT